MHQTKPLKSIPPRRFPEKQYRKQGRRFWIITVGIIVIILLVAGIFTEAVTEHPANHHHARVTRPIKKSRSKPVHHQQVTIKATPKRGEKLLGHWLIKLNYPTDKAQHVLTSYQKTNQLKETAITKKLIKFNRNQQAHQIRKLINSFR